MRDGERFKVGCKGGGGMVLMRVRHCVPAVRSEGTPVEKKVGNAVKTTAEYDGCRRGRHVVGTCGDRGWTRGERVGCDARGPRVIEWWINGRGKCVGHVVRHMSLNRGRLCVARWADTVVVTGGKGGNRCGCRAVTHAGRNRWLSLVDAGDSGVVPMVATCGDKGAVSVEVSAVYSVWRGVSQRLQRGWWNAGTIGLKTCGLLGGVPPVIPVPRDVAGRRSNRVQTTRGYGMHSRGAPVRPAAGNA